MVILEVLVPVITSIVGAVIGGVWYLRGKLDYQDYMLSALLTRLERVERKIEEK